MRRPHQASRARPKRWPQCWRGGPLSRLLLLPPLRPAHLTRPPHPPLLRLSLMTPWKTRRPPPLHKPHKPLLLQLLLQRRRRRNLWRRACGRSPTRRTARWCSRTAVTAACAPPSTTPSASAETGATTTAACGWRRGRTRRRVPCACGAETTYSWWFGLTRPAAWCTPTEWCWTLRRTNLPLPTRMGRRRGWVSQRLWLQA